MRHLIPYLKKYKLETIIAPLFKMLEACFDLIVPIIVANMIDNGITNGDKAYIFSRFALLIAMAVLGLLCSFIAQFFAARAAVGTAAGLRQSLLEKIQSFSFTALDRFGVSTLITRMTGDVNQVQNIINMLLRLFLRSPFIVFGSFIMAFVINKSAALIFALVIVALFIIVFGIMKITAPMYKDVQKNLDSVTDVTRESLNGVRVIRAFGRERSQEELSARINRRLLSAQIRVGKLSALLNPLTSVVINGGILFILMMGADKINSGAMLSGDVIALINYISQILVELVKLANLIVLFGKAAASMNRIAQILDTDGSMPFGTENVDDECRSSAIAVSFENVALRYNGAGDESLSDITFTAGKGETIGIIGGTGSGKTSLVNLINRSYDATSGTVYLYGKPITAFSRKALLENIAIVEQKPRLFSGTIRSNLLTAKRNATDAELWSALETAQAAEFVRKKDGGLDAEISQGGGNLSGGQKQRLTIARAILAGAKILILDDSASALDYATDAALRRAIANLPDELTVFIVSQRAGSIADADKILVMDDGKLVGCGKHSELIESCDIYKEIYQSQFKEEDNV